MAIDYSTLLTTFSVTVQYYLLKQYKKIFIAVVKRQTIQVWPNKISIEISCFSCRTCSTVGTLTCTQ